MRFSSAAWDSVFVARATLALGAAAAVFSCTDAIIAMANSVTV